MTSYSKGSWYPVGGSPAITSSILPTIQKTGGKVLTQRHVNEIIVKDGVAIGVKARTHRQSERVYCAPLVISDAGAFNTYTKLIPKEYAAAYRQQIRAFPKGYSMLFLFLGLKETPKTLGFSTENYRIFKAYDHDRALQERLAAPKVINSCMLSFPSLKNDRVERHTAEVIVYADYEYFTPWQAQPWRKRDAEYDELKEKIAQQIIDFVERYYPGFQDLIEYYELATPLTVESLVNSDRGAMYGIPSVPNRFDQNWISPKTPVKNLYLTGTDALHGIVGAMLGGVLTAGTLNGRWGFLKVLFAMVCQRMHKREK